MLIKKNNNNFKLIVIIVMNDSRIQVTSQVVAFKHCTSSEHFNQIHKINIEHKVTTSILISGFASNITSDTVGQTTAGLCSTHTHTKSILDGLLLAMIDSTND